MGSVCQTPEIPLRDLCIFVFNHRLFLAQKIAAPTTRCRCTSARHLTNPQPNLLLLKKAQAIWRGVLTAEVLKFPKEKHNVAFTLLKAATRLEKSSPEGCIALQRRALALMALELKQARYAAYAAEKALEEVFD